MPIWPPVAVIFCSPIAKLAVSCVESTTFLVDTFVPPVRKLLKGCVFLPHVKLVVKAVSKTESAVAI